MEFRKTVMIILYAGQQKRHRCKEQIFGLSGRRQGWDDLREWHWNMYITICKIDDQSKFNAWNKALKPVHWDNPKGWDGEGGGRQVQNEGHMYTCGWFMSVYCKNHHTPQYYKVISFQFKKKKKDSLLPLQGAQVQSLVGELRSHMLHGQKKK